MVRNFKNERRRARSPSPPKNNSNSGNGAAAAAASSSSTAADAAAASAYGFEIRRVVAAAFAKWGSTALKDMDKTAVMADVFAACDAAAFFDPVTSSAETTFAELQTKLANIFKDQEIVLWAMERCRKAITPQPRKSQPPPPAPAAPQPVVVARAAVNNNNNNNNSRQQQQQQVLPQFGVRAPGCVAGGSLLPVPQQAAGHQRSAPQQQQQQLHVGSVLPDPGDARVVVLVNITNEDSNVESTLRTAIFHAINNNVVKHVVCDVEGKRAIVFTYDAMQAMTLAALPPGSVLMSSPQSRFIECDKATMEAAVAAMRERARKWERAAREELQQILREEQGAGSEESQRDTALRAQIATAQAEMHKYEREQSLLEGLAASGIPGQAERLEVVRKDVAIRMERIETLSHELQSVAAGLEQAKRPVSHSSSSSDIGNIRSLIYFSGFGDIATTKGWSDARILAFLKHLPGAAPLHIWRSAKNTDICVELAGGPPAVFQVLSSLAYNDYRFCDIQVMKTRPSYQ